MHIKYKIASFEKVKDDIDVIFFYLFVDKTTVSALCKEGLCIDSNGYCVDIPVGKTFYFKCSSDPLVDMMECN